MATDPTNCCINVIHDVSTGRDLEVGVGYARDRPYLNADLLTPYVTTIPFDTSCNGQISIRVVNPLVCTADTSPVRFFIFARAKNMSFGVPRDSLRYIVNTADGLDDIDIRTRVKYQGALGDEDTTGPVKAVLTPPSGPFPGAELFFGEDFQSCRALMQKPSMLDYLVVSGNPMTFNFKQLMGPPNSVNTVIWTYAGWFSALFTGVACSERFKLFSETEAWFGGARVNTPSFTAVSYTPTMAPMSFVGANRGMEISIPYYRPLKYLLTRDIALPVPGEPVSSLRIYRDSASPEPTRAVLYYSFGPDIRVTCFRQVPTVSFRTLDDSQSIFDTEWWFNNPT